MGIIREIISVLLCSSAVHAQEPVTTTVVEKKTVEERLAELEAQQSLNYFSFSGTLVTSYDDLRAEETYPVKRDHDALDYLRLRFSLNIDAEVNPQVKVYSRTTVTKFFNRWQQQGNSGVFNEDLEIAYSEAGSQVYLERAYADLSPMGSDWTLSVGRLPTIHGSPSNFWDLLPRSGTYAMMSYNSILDGIAGTYRLDRYLAEGNQWALRLLYTPFTSVNGGTPGGADGFLNPPRQDTNAGTPTGSVTNTIMDLISFQSDYSSKNVDFTNQLGFILQGYQLTDLPIPSGAGTSNLNILYRAATASVELDGLGQSGFDISLNFSYNQNESRGFFNGPGTGFGTVKESDTIYGNLALISTRYRWEKWSLGYEWLEASKNSVYFSGAEEDLTDFYRTNGVGHHVYVTKKWMSYVTLRGGYRLQQLTNLPVFLGPAASTDRKVETLYVNMRTDF
ncbi:DUF3373 family protein [Bdellovibrio bacteriovorus]|uniref:DUF3373 family protein n=1 Tax=Bdellovibrio bacteriovorus TaxID=959 RepID=UPI0035A60E54